MITRLIQDYYENGKRVFSSGTPVQFVEFTPGYTTPRGNVELVIVRLPDGREVEVKSEAVSSGGWDGTEETLSVLSEKSGVREDTLLKAAQTGRLMARKSGSTWLSTLNAVEWAISDGRIRKP